MTVDGFGLLLVFSWNLRTLVLIAALEDTPNLCTIRKRDGIMIKKVDWERRVAPRHVPGFFGHSVCVPQLACIYH